MPNATSHGGYIRDLPLPHRRYWPNEAEQRGVTIRFRDWSAAIGGSHINLEIKEEHNYIWDEKERIWRECWDDDKGMGFRLDTKFERYEDAIKVARAIVRIMFQKHKVRWDGKRTRHVYAREGD
jgi:hypothetical protein